MSERGSSGFGAFLFGIALGAVAGFLFAPEGGEGTRRRVGKGQIGRASCRERVS